MYETNGGSGSFLIKLSIYRIGEADGTIRELNQTTLEFFHVQDSQVVGISLWESPWLISRRNVRKSVKPFVKRLRANLSVLKPAR